MARRLIKSWILLAFFGLASAFSYPDRLFQTIVLSSQPKALTISPGKRYVYLLSSEAKTLSVVDAFQWKEVSTVSLSSLPRDLGIQADGKKVYMITDTKGQVREYDLDNPAKPKLNKSISVGASSAQFSQVLVTGQSSDEKLVLTDTVTDRIYTYDFASEALDQVDTGMELTSVAMAPQGRVAALGSNGKVKLYDTETLSQQGNTLDFGALSSPNAFSHIVTSTLTSGTFAFVTRNSQPGQIWVGNLTNITSLISLGSISTGEDPVSSTVMKVFRPESGSGTKD